MPRGWPMAAKKETWFHQSAFTKASQASFNPDPASLDRRHLNSRLSVGLAARNKTFAGVNMV